MDIVSHKEWGASYLRPLQRTNVRNKTAFLVHYHGGEPRNSVGKAVPKEVEAIHHANGWNGLGYNFAVDQAGTIYEGYGWDGVGAQCPGFNTSGIGTYVAIGGDQKPTPEALASVRWLYDEGCRRSGNSLRKMGHRDGWATACPGPHLYAWVQAGMPAPANFDQEEDEMGARTDKEIAAAVLTTDGVLPTPDWVDKEKNPYWPASEYITRTYEVGRDIRTKVDRLEAQLGANSEALKAIADAVASGATGDDLLATVAERVDVWLSKRKLSLSEQEVAQ